MSQSTERLSTLVNLSVLGLIEPREPLPILRWKEALIHQLQDRGCTADQAKREVSLAWIPEARKLIKQPWYQKEKHPRFETITLGAEIEVLTEPQIPSFWIDSFAINRDIDDLVEFYSDHAYLTNSAGIPTGSDGCYEFSPNPIAHPSTLTAEIALLYRLNLLEEGIRYPLHITAGGLPKNANTHKLMCGVLATGKCISTGRLRDTSTYGPYHAKGIGGIESQYHRKPTHHPDPLVSNVATEMRLFELSDRDELSQTVDELFYLGTAQKGTKKPLADIWHNHIQQLDDLMAGYGVSPQTHRNELLATDNIDCFVGYCLHTPTETSLAAAIQNPTFCADAQAVVTRSVEAVKQILGEV